VGAKSPQALDVFSDSLFVPIMRKSNLGYVALIAVLLPLPVFAQNSVDSTKEKLLNQNEQVHKLHTVWSVQQVVHAKKIDVESRVAKERGGTWSSRTETTLLDANYRVGSQYRRDGGAYRYDCRAQAQGAAE
jgi:hypothetical protein